MIGTLINGTTSPTPLLCRRYKHLRRDMWLDTWPSEQLESGPLYDIVLTSQLSARAKAELAERGMAA